MITETNNEGYEIQDKYNVQGFTVCIENKKGTTRSGTDPNGKKWSIKMGADYGFFEGIMGADKEQCDVYVGPNKESKKVFIVHQQVPETKEYDEDKILIGFDSKEEAKKLYLSQFNKPGFFQSMDEMNIEDFRELVSSGRYENNTMKSLSIDKMRSLLKARRVWVKGTQKKKGHWRTITKQKKKIEEKDNTILELQEILKKNKSKK